jgi:hypothetical protein
VWKAFCAFQAACGNHQEKLPKATDIDFLSGGTFHWPSDFWFSCFPPSLSEVEKMSRQDRL